jgi:hypothetical protein
MIWAEALMRNRSVSTERGSDCSSRRTFCHDFSASRELVVPIQAAARAA